MIARYHKEPAIVATPLETGRESWFAVVRPCERTNLVSNPSLETNTTSWTAIGGSIARSTTEQYHGAYSLAITPTATTNDGARFDTVSLTSGTLYAYSAKVLGVKNVSYKLAIETTGGSELAAVTFLGTGTWAWIWGYYLETSSTTRRLTLRKDGSASTAVFYGDGFQVEALADASETVSTYLDGSLQGLLPNQSPAAFWWNGTPHASTSTRSGLTRAGGEVKPFSHYGFTLLSIVGLGLAAPQNVATEYARIDGGYADYTRKPSRQFTLVGRFNAMAPAQLDYDRSGLSSLLDRDASALDQELILRYQRLDARDAPVSDAALLRVKYQGGLEGNTESLHAEQAPITFTQYMPSIVAEGSAGAALNVQTSVANANVIIKRSPTGTYSVLGSGAAAAGQAIQDILVAPDGKVYVTGYAVNIGGVAAADGVAYWDGSAWNAMGTGLAVGGGGYSLAVDSSGRIYCGGAFNDAGGVANTGQLARWTGSAWESITPAGAANGIVAGMAFDSAGNLYAVGSFTSINAVAANRVAMMDTGGTWTALSTGLNGAANAVIVDPGDNVYLGGAFTTPSTRVTKWNGSAFSAMGSGLDGTVRKLVRAASGVIYAAGDFTDRASAFNGVTWTTLGAGLSGGVSQEVIITPAGQIMYGGLFTTAAGLTLPDAIAVWTGSSWIPLDVDLPGVGVAVEALTQAPDGSLYIGWEGAGTASAAGVTTVTNPGTARSYPTITIKGPSSGTSRIWTLENETTGRAIYFDAVIQAGDTWTLSFQPDNLSFTSAILGNIASVILPGSNAADWFLGPGDNVISMLAADSTVTATIAWQPAHARLDGLTR